MDQADPFAAQLIQTGARGFAAMAASRMFESDPGLEQRFAPRAFETWKESLAHRLQDLSVALAEGRPGSFSAQVAWTRTAFAAREVPLADLRTSLDSVHHVLLQELPPTAHPTVSACFEVALAELDRDEERSPERLTAETPHQRLAVEYVHALLSGDRRRAAQVVLGAVQAEELSVEDALTEVLIPAQAELGRMWHLNEISIAEEHFVTATTRMVIDQLLPLAQRKPDNGKAILTAAVAGDAHDIGLRVVSDFFDLDGWRVIHLGADVPARDLVAGVAEFRPDLVGLSATLEAQRRTAAEVIEAVQRLESGAPPVLVGGLAFEGAGEPWKLVGADGHAGSPREAVRVGRELVGLPPEG